MEWVLWLFIALFAVPVIIAMISPFVKAFRENARQELEERRKAERIRAAEEKQAAAKALAEQKRAVAAERRAEQERRRNERETEQRRRQAEKLAAARELAELRERALKAEKELRSLRSSAPAPSQAPVKQAAVQTPAESPEVNAAQSFSHAFAGEQIAFTGTLPTMTRAQAIKAVQDRGGRAYETINTNCTLIVVGQRPGQCQLDRADKWGVKRITWEEWFQQAGISWRRRQYAQALAKENRAA